MDYNLLIEDIIINAFRKDFFNNPKLLNFNMKLDNFLKKDLETISKYYSYYLLKNLREYNQYINLNKEEIKNLEFFILENLNSKDFGDKLLKYLKAYPEISILEDNLEIGKIPCSLYSAKSQIKYLNLDINNLLEPVLDIGCGYDGKLVNYLNELEYDAFGIDLYIDENNKNLKSANWLEYQYEKNKYGTIISHMAFSNHFNRENKKLESDYILYGKKYIEILNSLKVNGNFFYAPSVEFIEDPLEADYKVDREKIIKGKTATIVKRLK